MLSAVKEIGNLTEDTTKHIEGYLFAIVFNENMFFSDIDIEQFQKEKIPRYLYIEGESRGNKPAPIAPITDCDKTLKKIKSWIDGCKKVPILSKDEIELIENLSNALQQNEQEIMNVLQNKIPQIPKKTGKFLTLKLENGRKYLGDYAFFIKAQEYNISQRISKTSAKNKICSICGELKNSVSARTYVYNFDTDDKPGFISEFDKNNYWKNIPVCQECRNLLKRGRDFIETRLTFSFYGLKYQLIPKILLGGFEVIEEIIDILSDTHKTISLKDRIIKRLTNDENEILEYLSQKEDVLTLNFLFLQKQQSAERILLLIEDVFPSRLRALFDAKDYVDSQFGEDFNFGKIRIFFSKSDEDKRNSDLDNYFLEIVDSVFKEKKVDFAFLAKFFLQTIRKEFIKDGYYLPRIKDAMMCVLFFERLGLIIFEEVDMEGSIFDPIFTGYGKSLNTPAKRGIFLLGALTQMLLNKQYSERNSKPFMKKLKSLKMEEKDIIALFPEVQNKLEEYEAFDKGKRIIAEEISKYLLEAGRNWKMAIDEINFYFACGMNLSDEIAKLVYKQ